MDSPYHLKKGMEHGGALGRAAAVFGRPVGDWVDLSTGINPVAYPVPDLAEEVWTRLPEAEIHESFQATVAGYLRLADPGLITAAPGTQCLIQMLPRMRRASKVAVPSPTYNEHAHVWRSFGHEVVETTNLDQVDETFDVAARYEDLLVHRAARLDLEEVVVEAEEIFPPGVLELPLQQSSVAPVVVESREAAVYF